jgi:hypothetical protein
MEEVIVKDNLTVLNSKEMVKAGSGRGQMRGRDESGSLVKRPK